MTAKISITDHDSGEQIGQPETPQPQPQVIKPTPTPSELDSQPAFVHPIPTSEPPLEEMAKDIPSPEVPRFGTLQPKIDAHPLFSGAKEPVPKNRRWLKRTLAPLAGLIVVLTVLYLAIDAGLVKGYSHLPFHFFKAPISESAPVITPAKTTTTTPTTTDPYAGWKTFTSPYLAITFKYPSTWSAPAQPSQACTGAQAVNITPAGSDVSSAATSLNNSNFKKYSINVLQFGTQSSKCAPDGNNFNGATYSYLQSSDQLSAGIFKGDWLTFFGSTTKANTTKLPDTGMVTVNNYDGKKLSVSETGELNYKGKIYQIMVENDSGKFVQSGDPQQFDVNAFKTTTLYKDTILLLNSIN